MAVATLSLCDLLCFLRCKYDKFPTKVLKRALIDFYDSGSISNAKKQLLADIIKADFQDKVPTVPERRAGEMRTLNEIDDIFTLIAFLDERKLLGCLPLYVSDNPDNMPPIRLYEGDLKGLMAMLDMMNDKITSQGVTIAAIVSELHSRLSGPGPAANTANVHRSTTSQGVINTRVNAVIPGQSTTGNPVAAKLCLASDHNKPVSVNKPSMNWAERVAAASTPCRNRFDALTTTTDDDLSDNPYIEQQSRNYRRSSKRKMDDCVSPAKPVTQLLTKASDSTQRRRRSAVYGRSLNVGTGLAAANKLIPKGVYCIDNIDVSFSVEDIVQYVSSQGITVVSCFEAKPRFRRSDNYSNDRKAFRLCINNDHRDKLMDSSRWPDSVVVSEWFFKSQQATRMSRDNPIDKRPRAESPSQQQQQNRSEQDSATLKTVTIATDNYTSTLSDVISAEVHVDEDMDATIVTMNSCSVNPVNPVGSGSDSLNVNN
jgi:hypothetical protein